MVGFAWCTRKVCVHRAPAEVFLEFQSILGRHIKRGALSGAGGGSELNKSFYFFLIFSWELLSSDVIVIFIWVMYY